MNKAVKLQDPISFTLPDDIRNPDDYIDEIEKSFISEGIVAPEISVLRTLNHDEKVRWLLSLPEPDREFGCLGTIIIVTVYLCVMVIVGTTAAGDPIKEKKCEEKKVPKCVPKK
jgi:hypothetical protein